MFNNFLNLFNIILISLPSSDLFFIPLLFCLITYIVYLVFSLIRGRY